MITSILKWLLTSELAKTTTAALIHAAQGNKTEEDKAILRRQEIEAKVAALDALLRARNARRKKG